jgi:hypothetical protein
MKTIPYAKFEPKWLPIVVEIPTFRLQICIKIIYNNIGFPNNNDWICYILSFAAYSALPISINWKDDCWHELQFMQHVF